MQHYWSNENRHHRLPHLSQISPPACLCCCLSVCVSVSLCGRVYRCLTFENDLQFISQDVKGAVSRAGLGDDVLFQPASTGILVKVVTRVHASIHVLNETRRCTDREETSSEKLKKLIYSAGYRSESTNTYQKP